MSAGCPGLRDGAGLVACLALPAQPISSASSPQRLCGLLLILQVSRLHATLRPHLLRRVIKDVEKVGGRPCVMSVSLAS